jgi:hypothetical protein
VRNPRDFDGSNPGVFGVLAVLVRSRSQRIAAAVVFASLAAVGFVPLFGGPGYEQSIASGLVVPSAAALATSLEVSAPSDARASPLAVVSRGLASGAFLAAIALLTALLHGIRVGMCDGWGGTVLFLLTAGSGALLGGAWGAIVGEACRDRRLRRLACVLLALGAPVAGILVSVARFYATPMIFAYDPFFGYFSGALYDTVIDVRTELWTYRAGTAAALTGIILVAAALRRTASGGLAWERTRGNGRAVACLCGGCCAFASSLAIGASGPELGHWQSGASIARELGGRSSGPRCDVIHPDGLLAEQSAILVRDCEEELAADERVLGAHLGGRLTEYVFADSGQKRRLMGAGDTSIAKPWLREVYVQYESYPHPLLGHEIAHVVAGSFAPGPFHVGGGLWPNPGLIEGVAVATSPDDDELTSAQWARAMLDLGILPPSASLFSLDFLGANAAKSYTVAGAFIGWVTSRWTSSAVRAWYGGGSIERLTGRSWEALDREFRAWLGTLAMPAQASLYARARFERPGVWGRTCPHVVDALDGAGDRCRGEHRFGRAFVLYDEALARDPGDWHARFERAWVELEYGDSTRGREDLGRIATDERAPKPWRDRARETMADDDWARGRSGDAVAVYRDLAAQTLDEDAGRTLDVKALTAADPAAARAVADLLVGQRGRPTDPWLGALALGVWAGATHDPLADYLAGKNLAVHEDWERASVWLDEALREPMPTARIGRELVRMRAICACALRDSSSLAHLRGSLGQPDSPFASGSGGRREWLTRLMDRCDVEGRP